MNNATFQAMRTASEDRRHADGDDKSRGYTRGADDRFANFKRQAEKKHTTPQFILSVYMDKHLDPVDYWIETGFEDEAGLLSHLDDVRTYCDLLEGMYVEAMDRRVVGFGETVH